MTRKYVTELIIATNSCTNLTGLGFLRTFEHSIIDRAANLSHGLYGDFQMPENTERSDYQCETPKNWITGRIISKVVGGNVR